MKVYRALLVLYPRAFREQFGPDMVQLFADRLRDRGRAQAWSLVVVDLVITVPEQLMEGVVMSANKVVLGFVGLAIALLAIPLLGIQRAGILTVGLAVIALSLALASYLVSRRSARSSESDYDGAVRRWPWWTFIALPLAGYYASLAALGLPDAAGDIDTILGLEVLPAAVIIGGLVVRSRGKVWANPFIAAAALPAISWFWVVVPPFFGIALILCCLYDMAGAGVRSLRMRGLNRA